MCHLTRVAPYDVGAAVTPLSWGRTLKLCKATTCPHGHRARKGLQESDLATPSRQLAAREAPLPSELPGEAACVGGCADLPGLASPPQSGGDTAANPGSPNSPAPGFCITWQARGSPATATSTPAAEHAKHLGWRLVPMETGVGTHPERCLQGPRPVRTLRQKPEPRLLPLPLSATSKSSRPLLKTPARPEFQK